MWKTLCLLILAAGWAAVFIVAGTIGHAGRAGGQFHWVRVAAMDSHGHVYAGEVETGKRVQEFVPVN